MNSDNIKAGFAGISKLEKDALEAVLVTVSDQELVDDTKLLVNCHHVALDGSCLPRLTDLTDNLARWVQEYVIPRSTLQKADNSAPHIRRRKEAALRQQALETFKKNGISGEQGELLMFVIAEAILGLPQLLCKMDLKTDNLDEAGAFHWILENNWRELGFPKLVELEIERIIENRGQEFAPNSQP